MHDAPNTRQGFVQRCADCVSLSEKIVPFNVDILIIFLGKGHCNIGPQPSQRIQSTGKFDVKGLILNVYQSLNDAPVSRTLREKLNNLETPAHLDGLDTGARPVRSMKAQIALVTCSGNFLCEG